MNFREMTNEQLQELIKGAREELEQRNKDNLVYYAHDCRESSNYHKRKYKHWTKKVAAVDTSKTNGYALQGDFLSVEQEHKLPVGTVVVEHCSTDGTIAYRMTPEGPEKITSTGGKPNVAFIEKLAEEF